MTSKDQELAYWRSDAVTGYFQADAGMDIQRRIDFWREVLLERVERSIGTVIEPGCGTGANLAALREVLGPLAVITGSDPNVAALRLAIGRNVADDLLEWSIFDLSGRGRRLHSDLVLTHGLLIHIPPDGRPEALRIIASLASRLVALVEYGPEAAQTERCWPGDFGAEFLTVTDRFTLAEKRDGPQDGTTAWIFERVR